MIAAMGSVSQSGLPLGRRAKARTVRMASARTAKATAVRVIRRSQWVERPLAGLFIVGIVA